MMFDGINIYMMFDGMNIYRDCDMNCSFYIFIFMITS